MAPVTVQELERPGGPGADFYRPRTQAYAHQLEALKRISEKPRHPSGSDAFALLMEQGTGKSKVVCDEWGSRSAELPNLLVISRAGCYLNWVEDKTEAHQSHLRTHLDPALFARLRTAAWRSGGGKARRAALDAFLRVSGPRAMAVNIEALSSATSGARDACRAFLQSAPTMLVVDESTAIMRDSRRTKAVMALAPLAPVRRVLTGLPTPRSPLDAFHQFEFLDWRILGHRTPTSFRARYAVTKRVCFLPREAVFARLKGRGVPDAELTGSRDDLLAVAQKYRIFVQHVDVVQGYRNLDELQRLTGAYSYRVLKDECLDLPPKVYQVRDVEATPQQARMYRELVDQATTQLDAMSHVTATETVVRIMRLHQLLCGWAVDEAGEWRSVPTNKTKALVEVLEECAGKAVVWVSYDEDVGRVVAAVEDAFWPGVTARFWGGNLASRADEERRWMADDACRFMVSTPASGGFGNTWTQAGTVVFYSNSDNLEHRMQAEDRCHRAGLRHSVSYYDLVVPGTVDAKIIGSMRKKIDLAAAVTGDGYREWLV